MAISCGIYWLDMFQKWSLDRMTMTHTWVLPGLRIVYLLVLFILFLNEVLKTLAKLVINRNC